MSLLIHAFTAVEQSPLHHDTLIWCHRAFYREVRIASALNAHRRNAVRVKSAFCTVQAVCMLLVARDCARDTVPAVQH